jgi:lactoylglutathione lyase
VEPLSEHNVKQAVPFFLVSDINASLRFYVDGLDFKMTNTWIVDGVLRWCWLEIGDAAIMLQEFWKAGDDPSLPKGKPGFGVSICFMCADALGIYRSAKSRGLEVSRPFVGNGLWVTSLTDPDGYRLDFESKTDAREESVFTDDEEDRTE